MCQLPPRREATNIWPVRCLCLTMDLNNFPLLSATSMNAATNMDSGETVSVDTSTSNQSEVRPTRGLSRLEQDYILRVINAKSNINETVLARIPYASLPLDRRVFIRSIREKFPTIHIKAVGLTGINTLWAVMLGSPEEKAEVLASPEVPVPDKEPVMLIDYKTVNTIRIRVYRTPVYASERDIAKAFVQLGQVKGLFKTLDEDEVPTDEVKVIMEMPLTVVPDDLPDNVTILGIECPLIVPGKAPVCYRCRVRGHVRSQCSAPYCTKCKRVGHSDDTCRGKSWANKVKEVNLVPDQSHLERMIEEVYAQRLAENQDALNGKPKGKGESKVNRKNNNREQKKKEVQDHGDNVEVTKEQVETEEVNNKEEVEAPVANAAHIDYFDVQDTYKNPALLEPPGSPLEYQVMEVVLPPRESRKRDRSEINTEDTDETKRFGVDPDPPIQQ